MLGTSGLLAGRLCVYNARVARYSEDKRKDVLHFRKIIAVFLIHPLHSLIIITM